MEFYKGKNTVWHENEIAHFNTGRIKESLFYNIVYQGCYVQKNQKIQIWPYSVSKIPNLPHLPEIYN
jgi:hypothetical protein